MGLEANIDIDAFKNLNTFLTDVERKALPRANRNSMNKSLITLRKEVIEGIRKKRNLKKTEIKKDYMKEFRAKGNNIEKQKASLRVFDRRISMIRFVTKSQRNVEDQSGKSVRQRRKLKIQVTPGNKRKTKLFVAKGKGGKLHVFRRIKGSENSKGKEIMAKQSVSGLGTLMNKYKRIRIDAVGVASRRYEKELPKQLAFFVEKLSRKK